MATSKLEYHREAIDQVLDLLNLKPTAEEREEWDVLRTRINKESGDTLLMAAVADFWLDLDRYEGAWRRKQPTPPSPFRRQGRKQVAAKAPIAAWHDAHEAEGLQRRLAIELRRMKDLARTREGGEAYEILEKMSQEWAVKSGRILGHLAFLPAGVDLGDLAELDIVRLPLDQAMRRPWVDRAEASLWLEILAGCQRMQLADLQQIQLEQGTAPAEALPSRRPLRP